MSTAIGWTDRGRFWVQPVLCIFHPEGHVSQQNRGVSFFSSCLCLCLLPLLLILLFLPFPSLSLPSIHTPCALQVYVLNRTAKPRCNTETTQWFCSSSSFCKWFGFGLGFTSLVRAFISLTIIGYTIHWSTRKQLIKQDFFLSTSREEGGSGKRGLH